MDTDLTGESGSRSYTFPAEQQTMIPADQQTAFPMDQPKNFSVKPSKKVFNFWNNICVVHDTNDHVSVLSQSHECRLYVCVMQVPVWHRLLA